MTWHVIVAGDEDMASRNRKSQTVRCVELEEKVRQLEAQLQALQEKEPKPQDAAPAKPEAPKQPKPQTKKPVSNEQPMAVSIVHATIFAKPESPTPTPTPDSLKSLELEKLNLAKWVESHGWLHLEKSFKREGYRLVCHVCIDENADCFHTLTTYFYPDGTWLISKYGATEKRIPFGGKTPQEVLTRYEKAGYKRMFSFSPSKSNRKKCKILFVNLIGDLFPTEERRRSFTEFVVKSVASKLLREHGEEEAAKAVWRDDDLRAGLRPSAL